MRFFTFMPVIWWRCSNYFRMEQEVIKIGSDLKAGLRLQVVVPRGAWQGSRLVEGGRFALLGATVAPGFEFSDFESGVRETLIDQYPDHADLISQLTRH